MDARKRLLVVLALVAVIVPACNRSKARKPTFATTGKVLINGKPAEHATIVLHPVGESGPDVVKPRGKVAADGTFKLTTYDGDDGAPAGDYHVTLELWLSSNRPDEGPTSRLPPQLANPETSGLKATVGKGPTELPPYEIKR